jgi:hypothetical protein
VEYEFHRVGDPGVGSVTDLPRSPEEKLADALRGVKPDEYGPAYREHSLELYKCYLEMADRISGRREKANSFFLAVNTALIALLAKDAFGDGVAPPHALEVLVPAAAAVLCYLWHRMIRSYRDLNSAKFKVIHAIERQLPLRPYDAEWESVERGKNSRLYLPFTHIEGVVPWLFMAFHGVLAACSVPWTTIWTAVRGLW